jgi:hypothetical protein
MAHRSKNQWVIPYEGKWAVKGEGNSKVTRTTETQSEAIELASRIALEQGTEVIVQDRHGQISIREPEPQFQKIRTLLAEWDAHPDPAPEDWWNEFEEFIRENRMTFNRD